MIELTVLAIVALGLFMVALFVLGLVIRGVFWLLLLPVRLILGVLFLPFLLIKAILEDAPEPMERAAMEVRRS